VAFNYVAAAAVSNLAAQLLHPVLLLWVGNNVAAGRK
jgi:hypothetical protein